MAQRTVIETDFIDTIADGVAGRCPIPEVLDDLLVVLDDVILVREDSIKAGMRLLYEHAGLVVEPSAALGIAAILEDPDRFAGRRVTTILCGSNVGPADFARWVLEHQIQDVINDVKNQIRNPDKLQIVFPEPKEPLYIEADKIRLYQVIANLLGNAIKFTREGTITFSTNVKDNDELIVTVKDTGTGLHPDILPRLFTKFATKADAGTGLGLYISKSIVEVMEEECGQRIIQMV